MIFRVRRSRQICLGVDLTHLGGGRFPGFDTLQENAMLLCYRRSAEYLRLLSAVNAVVAVNLACVVGQKMVCLPVRQSQWRSRT